MANGSCLCGQVTYKIDGKISDIVHCHCYKCRKAHSAAFSSVASVKQEHFQLAGAQHLRSFESSAGKHRYFCTTCGSQIYSQRDNHPNVVVRLGCLDSGTDSQEFAHTWISQKAGWYCLDTALPQFEEGYKPPSKTS